MRAPPTFLVRRPAARYFLGEEAMSQTDRDALLASMDAPVLSFMSIRGWVAGHDIDAELGTDADQFRTLLAQANTINDDLFNLEGSLRSEDPADWIATADQISEIQQLTNLANALWAIINNHKSSTNAGSSQPVEQPGFQTSPTNPDLIYNPPVQPTQPAGGSGSSWGTPDALKLITAGGLVASPFIKKTATTTAPKPGGLVTTSTGMPWWGWALIGLGGLGAVGVGFSLLRRIF